MEMSRVQDCVMSGRKNCAPIDTDGSNARFELRLSHRRFPALSSSSPS